MAKEKGGRVPRARSRAAHGGADRSFRYKDGVTESHPFDGVPEQIVDLCQSLTDFVDRAIGIRPDYTSDTLPIVDHYLAIARGQVEAKPAILDLTAQAIGAYFGEVVRRHFTGMWSVPSPNFHDWQLYGQAAYFAINPIGVGYDLLTRGNHDGPSPELKMAKEDRELVAARLESLPPEREESYYSLGTRFEALEIAIECIRAQAEARGYSEMVYDLEDYYSLSSGLPLPNA